MRIIFGMLVVVIIIFFSALIFEKYLAEDTLEITITKIKKVLTEEGERYYLVYTKNEVFENRDHYFHNKSNADRLNAMMKPKKKYMVKVVGYNLGIKIPFFLEHRNILEIIDKKSLYHKGVIK